MTAYPFKPGPGLPLSGQPGRSSSSQSGGNCSQQLPTYVRSLRDGIVLGRATTQEELSALELSRAEYDKKP